MKVCFEVEKNDTKRFEALDALARCSDSLTVDTIYEILIRNAKRERTQEESRQSESFLGK